MGTPMVSWAGPEPGAVSEMQGRPNTVHAGSCPERAGLLEACWNVLLEHCSRAYVAEGCHGMLRLVGDKIQGHKEVCGAKQRKAFLFDVLIHSTNVC